MAKLSWIKNLRFESERGTKVKKLSLSWLKILQFQKGPKKSETIKSFGGKMFLG